MNYTTSCRPHRCPGCRGRTPTGGVRRRKPHDTRYWTLLDAEGRILISAPECLFLSLWAGPTRYRMSDADRELLKVICNGQQ